MSSSRLRPLRASRRCAFCSGSELTKEHIWPKWAAVHFPRTPHDQRFEVLRAEEIKSRTVTSFDRRERHGHTTTKTVKVVCRRCNGSWMGTLEEQARPFLETMLLGKPAVLDPKAQELVARWVTLKMMVIDLATPADTVFLAEDRAKFMKLGTIPIGMKIWLFPYSGADWRSAMRQDSYLIGTSPVGLPHGSLAKNTKSLTLGFGALLIHAFFTHLARFDDYATIDFEGSVAHLWPMRRKVLAWPPGAALTEAGAGYVSENMARLTRSPKVIALDRPR